MYNKIGFSLDLGQITQNFEKKFKIYTKIKDIYITKKSILFGVRIKINYMNINK